MQLDRHGKMAWPRWHPSSRSGQSADSTYVRVSLCRWEPEELPPQGNLPHPVPGPATRQPQSQLAWVGGRTSQDVDASARGALPSYLWPNQDSNFLRSLVELGRIICPHLKLLNFSKPALTQPTTEPVIAASWQFSVAGNWPDCKWITSTRATSARRWGRCWRWRRTSSSSYLLSG